MVVAGDVARQEAGMQSSFGNPPHPVPMSRDGVSCHVLHLGPPNSWRSASRTKSGPSGYVHMVEQNKSSGKVIAGVLLN